MDTLTMFVFVAGALALSGTKVGQNRYSDELDRARCLALLSGADLTSMYHESTSSRGTARAFAAGVTAASVTMIVCLRGTATITESLAFAATLGTLTTAGLLGYQICAQAAVLLNSFKIPQYIYLLFSLAVLTPAATYGVATMTNGGHTTRPGAVFMTATASLSALACCVALITLKAVEVRLATGRTYGEWLPTIPRTSRNLPLPIKLWTTRGRAYGSVIMGLTMVLAIIIRFAPQALRDSMVGVVGYKQTNIAVAILYLVVLLTMHIAEAPLEMASISKRRWLHNLAAMRRGSELFSGAIFIMSVATAVGLLAFILMARQLPAVAALHPVTMVLVLAAIVLGAIGLVLPGDTDSTQRLAGTNMFARTCRSAFVALLAACMAVGYESAETPGPSGLVICWTALTACLAYLAFTNFRSMLGDANA